MANTTTIQEQVERISKLKDSICEEVNTYFGGGGSNLDSVEYALSYHQLGYGNSNITHNPVDGYYIIIEFHKDKAEVFDTAGGDYRGEHPKFLHIININGIDTYYAPTVRTMGNREFNYFIIDNCSEWFKSNRNDQMNITFTEPQMIDEYEDYEIEELSYANGDRTSDGDVGIINIDKDTRTLKIGIYIDKNSLWGNDDNRVDILYGYSDAESTVRFYKIFRKVSQ